MPIPLLFLLLQRDPENEYRSRRCHKLQQQPSKDNHHNNNRSILICNNDATATQLWTTTAYPGTAPEAVQKIGQDG